MNDTNNGPFKNLYLCLHYGQSNFLYFSKLFCLFVINLQLFVIETKLATENLFWIVFLLGETNKIECNLLIG